MKTFINILMAAYIAFVACYPCSDKDVCVDDKMKGVEEALISSHEHSPDEIDLCSPFCICSCCSATLNQPKYFSFIFYAPQMQEFNSFLRTRDLINISYSIWQPPKLA